MEPFVKKRRIGNTSDSSEGLEASSSSGSNVEVFEEHIPVSNSTQNLQHCTTVTSHPSTNVLDRRIQELLLSSPAHLFSIGALNSQQTSVSTSWEQWLCFLASNLSPSQWQGYWLAHCALFGEQAVPVHLLSFFSNQTSGLEPCSSSHSVADSTPLNLHQHPHPNDAIHTKYDNFHQVRPSMGNAARGGSGNSRRAEFANATVFLNGRLAATETSGPRSSAVVAAVARTTTISEIGQRLLLSSNVAMRKNVGEAFAANQRQHFFANFALGFVGVSACASSSSSND
ncbi:unnamed protein product [Caenorhabditis bovis]|uniref:Uncharacterized protein n=1 Tax=Caenorhabditis bovis TaxID=2654633 RepID=A0A8S1F391_9PELO|nr:unnamed protein product [Caenorhabditis bovis]